MKTQFAIRKIEEWSYDYIKMDCAEGKCYGVLAVCIVFCHAVPLSSLFIEGPPHLLCTVTLSCPLELFFDRG